MADSSVSTLILFIASVMVAGAVSGVLIDTVDTMSGALDDRGADLSSDIRTDVEIISDPSGPIYDGTNVTVHVKNTGEEDLPAEPSTVDVVMDGNYQTGVTVTPLDGSSWGRTDVVRLEFGASLSTGDHLLTLTVGEDTETFEFRT